MLQARGCARNTQVSKLSKLHFGCLISSFLKARLWYYHLDSTDTLLEQWAEFSWCFDTRLSPGIMMLNKTLELIFLNNAVKTAYMLLFLPHFSFHFIFCLHDRICSTLRTTSSLSTELLLGFSAKSVDNCHLTVNHTEKLFQGSGNLCRCSELRKLLGYDAIPF